MHHAAKRPERSRQTYEFAGYIACIHCGLTLRCQGHSVTKHLYYRDTAKSRRIPCSTEGDLTIRADYARDNFGELLKSLALPENWREIIRRQMLAEARKEGQTEESVEREKERLKLKKVRTIKLYKEGYIEDAEFQGEMAAVELAIRKLNIPEVDGVTYDEVIEAGEHIPGMAALWDVATPEERQQMLILMLEPGGLYYDMEQKIIAALKPRPAFLPILRMLNGIVEYDEARGLLLAERWQERNRRATSTLSPILYLFQLPTSTLSRKLQITLSVLETPLVLETQRRPGPKDIPYGIPVSEWPTVLARVENHESYRTIARDYGVSRETISRFVQALTKAG
jgi:site-specific DNA recombinase